MKFVWGILAGGAVFAALLWLMFAVSEPQRPTQSAVVEQPSGQVVSTTTDSGATVLPAADARSDATAATQGSPAPAGDAASALKGADEGQPGVLAATPAEAGPAGDGTTGAAEVAGATAATGTTGDTAPVAGTEPAEGSAAAGDAPASVAAGAATPDAGPAGQAGEPEQTGQAEQPGQAQQGGDAGRTETLAALAPAAPAPAADTLAMPGQATTPAPESTPSPPPDPMAASFDIVRVDASGETVIAGRAQPGQTVEVLLDGEVAATEQADATGRFVAIIDADLSGQARQLQLRVSVPSLDLASVEPGAGAGPAAQQAEGAAASGGPAPAGDSAAGGQTPTAGSAAAGGVGAPSTGAPAEHAVDAAAVSAPAAPSGLTAAVPGADAAQGALPGATSMTAGPSPQLALPDQPLLGQPLSAGHAPTAEGLRLPAAPEPAGGAQGGGAAPVAGDAQATTAASDAGATGVAAPDATAGSAEGQAPAGGAAAGPAGASGSTETAGATGAPQAGSNLSDTAPSPVGQAPALALPATGGMEPQPGLAGAPAPPAAPPGGRPQALAGGVAPGAVLGGTSSGGAAPSGAAGSAGPVPAAPGAPGAVPQAGSRYVLSEPVLILPSARAEDAPALVQQKQDELALLQPGGNAGDAASEGVVLDQISYADGGDVLLRGRARPRHAVRIYGDGQILATVPVRGGAWEASLPRGRVDALSLFRVDEIGPAGQVTSRVEAPFRYTGDRPLVLRDREVVIQRGDNLWRIAEHYYGEGMRYSLIYGANSDLIRDPDLIYPDQVFSIPELVEAD